MTPRLRTEVTAYQMCVLDDSWQEGPHAAIGQLTKHAPCSSAAWWSATIRLGQNISARASADSQLPGSFEWRFKHWKIMGQLDQFRYNRGAVQRIKTPQFLSFLYRSGQQSLRDCGDTKELAVSATAGTRSRGQRRRSYAHELRVDYLRSHLKSGKVGQLPRSENVHLVHGLGESLPAPAASSFEADGFFQVITTEVTGKKHVLTDGSRHWKSMSLPVVIQNMSVWSATSTKRVPVTYEDGHPHVCDALGLAPWQQLSRNLTLWSVARASAVDGCVELADPQLANKIKWSVSWKP